MGTRRVSSPHGEFTLFFTHKSPFSNFFQCSFKAKAIDKNSIDCTCVEQFYMYNKAINCGDHAAAKKILEIDEPRQIKRLGSQLLGFDKAKWDDISENVMKTALKAKFSMNEDLRQLLFATHGSELVECSPMDRIWGIGLPIDAPEAQNPKLWNGGNKLGKLMTKLREKLWKKKKFRDDRQQAEELKTPEDAIKYFEKHCRYSPERSYMSFPRPEFTSISGTRIYSVDRPRRRLHSRSPTPPHARKHPRISFHSEPSKRYRKETPPSRMRREKTPDSSPEKAVVSTIVKVGSSQSSNHRRSPSPLRRSHNEKNSSQSLSRPSSQIRPRSRRDSYETDPNKTVEKVHELRGKDSEKKDETPADAQRKVEKVGGSSVKSYRPRSPSTPRRCPVNKSFRRPSEDISSVAADLKTTPEKNKKENNESKNSSEPKEEKKEVEKPVVKREPIKWTDDNLPRSFRSTESSGSSSSDNEEHKNSRKRTRSRSPSPKRRRRIPSPEHRRRYRFPLFKRRR